MMAIAEMSDILTLKLKVYFKCQILKNILPTITAYFVIIIYILNFLELNCVTMEILFT